MSATLQFLRIEHSPAGVVEITIARPKALNALNVEVLIELETVLATLAQNVPACVILTGDGHKAFVAGADIAAMSVMSTPEAEAFARLGHRVFEALETFPSPTIAAVNGFALGGGCELALACDLIYAAEHAKFAQPEVKLGLIPGFGGSVRLPRKIGQAAASEWIFTGRMVDAAQAQALGLVCRVFPAAELMPGVREIAAEISQRAPLAVRASKRVILHAVGAGMSASLNLEQQQFAKLFASDDVREGISAFLLKRDPQFKGG